jgi:hypothetical protein
MITWLETVLASPPLGVLATIAFVWLVGLLTGLMISGRPNGRPAEPDGLETFVDPQLASLERHYKEWQAHQLLEDNRDGRRYRD